MLGSAGGKTFCHQAARKMQHFSVPIKSDFFASEFNDLADSVLLSSKLMSDNIPRSRS
jgi:hypothetical protein